MPELSLEIIGLLIAVFIAVMFNYGKNGANVDKMESMFGRITFFVILNLVAEGIASYMNAHKSVFAPIYQLVIMEVYYLSLLCVLYSCFSYVKRMINLDLPSLKKIGNWAGYVIFVIMVTLLAVPQLCVRITDTGVTFSKYVYICYFLLIAYELFLGMLFFRNRKYINPRRKKIIVSAYIVQFLCIVVQATSQHLFMAGVGVLMLYISFFMTLEDNDVRLIEQLDVEKEKATLANASKTEFIANVSHEIRTPINAVLGMDEMILRETKEETTRQYAMDIKSAAQTLHGIINEILDMSKMESGKMEIVPANYNMRSLLNDSVNVIQMKMNEKKLDFVVDVDPEMPAGYFGDEMRIKQVLNNLLSNAVKYTLEGSVTLTVRGQREVGKKAVLSFEIKDTGIGMKPEDKEQLFVAYKRFDSGVNKNVEGTGLGMTITMQILELMGSSLEVESEYGKGTAFSFKLTQDIWDDTPLGNFRNRSVELSGNYKYEKSFEAPETKVLVVDDNTINRKVFVGLLKDTKLQIDEADSGPACLELIKTNNYKIVFMDHMMPEMDGIETFHRMKKMENNMSKDAVVIMLTANAVSGAREQYMEEGFDDFMAKPIIPQKLEEMIKKYI